MSRIVYDVDMVNQNGSPVCFLACAAMVMQFRQHSTPTAGALLQRDHDFRGPATVNREPHTVTGRQEVDVLRKLGFATARLEEVRRTVAEAPDRAPPSVQSPRPTTPQLSDESVIYRLLMQFGPFILRHHSGAFWYGPGNTPARRGVGHSVVLTGIDLTRHVMYFNNPWGHINVMTTSRSIVAAIHRWESNPVNPSIAYFDEPMRRNY